MAYDSGRDRIVMFGGLWGGDDPFYGGYTTYHLAETWEWDGSAWTDRTPTQGNSPPAGDRAVMAYDSARQRVWVVDDFGQLWYWDLSPLAQPAVQLELDISSADIAVQQIERLEVDAVCAAVHSPAGTPVAGATLYGWSTGYDTAAPGAWQRLDVNEAGLTADHTGIAPGGNANLAWVSSNPEVAQSYVVQRDGRLSFECRPSGPRGTDGPAPAVGFDFLEIRLRYRAQ
jgi:hypothetical protein